MYFPGGDASTQSCGCYANQSCALDANSATPLRCNCDANDGIEREDGGLLTNKAELPIKKFCAGDTGRCDVGNSDYMVSWETTVKSSISLESIYSKDQTWKVLQYISVAFF